MTLYVAFNEGEALDDGSNISATTAVGQITDVARGGFRFTTTSGGSQNNPLTQDSVSFSGPTEGWIKTRIQVLNGGGNVARGDTYFIYDDVGNEILKLTSSYDSGKMELVTVLDGSGESTELYNFTAAEKDIDFHIRVDGSTNGFIKCFIDGILFYDQSGDTTGGGTGTTLAKITFSDPGYQALDETSQYVGFAQVIVSDDTTVGAKVYTLYPTSSSINDWAVGDYTDVDEAGVDDTDQIQTNSYQDEFRWDSTVTIPTLTSTEFISGVVQTWRGSADASSPVSQITPFLSDTTGTGISLGTTQSLTTGLANYIEVWETDPSDATNWDETKVNNQEFGIRSET